MFHRAIQCLLVVAMATGCSDTDSDSPTNPEPPTADRADRFVARGEHAVGYSQLETPDGMMVKAWFPTAAAGRTIEYAVPAKLFGTPDDEYVVMGNAHLDAEPVAGTFPLVVFSHGFALSPEWYPLAEHLASYGFVVLGPEHIETDWDADILPATVERPRAVSAVIDLAEDGALGGIIDTSAVAVVGHSYGGYTALASAGARFDLDHLAERCATEEDPFNLGLFCQPFLTGTEALAERMGLSEVPTGLWPSLRDPRVTAIVPIAGDSYLFGEAGLAEVTVPTLVIAGTADVGTPWDWGPGPTFEHIGSSSRAMVGLTGARHFVTVTSCNNLPFIAAVPEEYQEFICNESGWSKQDGLDLIHHMTTAFLLHHTGHPDAHESLDSTVYAGETGLELQFDVE